MGRDQKTGETLIFSDGNREQFGAEGLIISITLTLIGMLFILIVVSGEKVKGRYSVIAGIASLAAIYWLVMQLEGVYRAKSWYGPSFFPPGEYKSGPLSRDQGNNI